MLIQEKQNDQVKVNYVQPGMLHAWLLDFHDVLTLSL